MIRTIEKSAIPESHRKRSSVIRQKVEAELQALQSELNAHPLSPYEAKVITIDIRGAKPKPNNVLIALLKATNDWIKEAKHPYIAYSRTNPETDKRAIYVELPGETVQEVPKEAQNGHVKSRRSLLSATA